MFEIRDASELADLAASHGPAGAFMASPPEIEDDITVAEQMMTIARAHGLAEPTDLADFAIDAFDCEPLLDRVPRPMSRGERQLCGLLIVFARPFDALFIIEPMAGLDARRRRAVADLLTDLAEDRRIVSTTVL